MTCAQTPNAKAVDFSKTRISMVPLISAFVRRRKSVSLRTIQKWFSGTPAEFVNQQVDQALTEQCITIVRNGLTRRAGYVYEYSEGLRVPLG